MDDADKRESDAAEQTPPKTKSEDNPWYLLATLYGVPEENDRKLQAKNRAAWNRYFAANLNEEARTKLVEENRHPAEELRPFSPEELQKVATAFAERCKASAKNFTLPASDTNIEFSNVDFKKGAFLNRCLFSGVAFDGATFSGEADFGGATFSSWAMFGGATFSEMAMFGGATFSEMAMFNGATFSGEANFGGATFSDFAMFDSATFSGEANFGKALGRKKISFTRFGGLTSFINAKMKGETSFEGAIFDEEPPRFFGATLHQSAVWRRIKWPPPETKDEAGAFLDAYACLKLEMNRLKKHEDELDFFALELQSRRVLLGPRRGLPIWLYGVLSDYGRSYARPFLWLLVVAAIGTVLLVFSDALPIEKSFGLSAANTLNVFGFRKDFFDAATIERLPALLKILSALQTILGAILLFLFGLGVRNKFRMK